jgi:hypothetical protein
MIIGSSWRILFANPLILVPWLINAVIIAFIQVIFPNLVGDRLTTTAGTNGAIPSFPLGQRYIVISTLLTAAYSSCTAQVIWNHGKIRFSEANQLFKKNIRRIFVFGSVSFVCTYIISRALSGPLAMLAPLILVVIGFFSTYWIAAVVVGGSGILHGFRISANLASQKFLRTATLYIAPTITGISVWFIVGILYSIHVLSLSNAEFLLPLVFILSLPTTACYLIAVVGEYCASYGSQETHRQTNVEKPIVMRWTIWVRRIFLAIIVFCVAAIFLVIQNRPSAIPRAASDWKKISPSSLATRSVTDALGTHIIPSGFQEPSVDAGGLFALLGITSAVMQNPSNGTRILLFGLKNTSEPEMGNGLLKREMKICSSITPLPDDVFKLGDQILSFQRLSCTGSEHSHAVQMETETGSFLVNSPARRRISISIIGLQGIWDSNMIHDLVRSFH